VSGAAPHAGGAVVLALAAGVALPGFAGRSAPVACTTPSARAEAAGRTVEVACGAGEGAALQGAARLLFGLRLDPNRADAAALEALPQLGPARAQALVAARRQQVFCGPLDLERVSGIGPRVRAAVAPWLDFAGAGPCPGGRGGDDRGACPPAEFGTSDVRGCVR
jgi:competence protein ComEA